MSRDRGESGHRHHHASSVERTEEADLEKLATELKDFGGVADDGSSSGRKRERSIDDEDIEVSNPTPPKQIMKMSEFSREMIIMLFLKFWGDLSSFDSIL